MIQLNKGPTRQLLVTDRIWPLVSVALVISSVLMLFISARDSWAGVTKHNTGNPDTQSPFMLASGTSRQLPSIIGGDSDVRWSIIRSGEPIRNSFIEPFIWEGTHAATIHGGHSSTVWWDDNFWNTRGDTGHNAISAAGAGNHIDIHYSSPDLDDGTRVNERFVLGGDGGPGVGVMHLDFEGIMSARLRNPMLISSGDPGVVDLWAPTFVTTGHWWEVAISPSSTVVGGEFTAVPSPSHKFSGNPGSGHEPAEDSLNFITIGRNDVPCNSGWELLTGVAKSVDHYREHIAGPTVPIDPHEKDVLYHWRLEFHPDKVEVYADLDIDGVREHLHTFQVEIPWDEVYVHLLGVAYQADHHPQDGDCGAYQGQIRELSWKDVRISPVKYERTAAYPKDIGAERSTQASGWVGYDTRDTQRFGEVEVTDPVTGQVKTIPQPNPGPYNVHYSMAFCSDDRVHGCEDKIASKTLSFDLPAADAVNMVHAQLIYDVRRDGSAELSVNGTPVGSMPRATTVPGASEEQWAQRSIDVDPNIFKAGTNTITMDLHGDIQLDRLQLEFGYSSTGVVSSTGMYTAPSGVVEPVTVEVQATSTSDPDHPTVVVVTVVPDACVQVPDLFQVVRFFGERSGLADLNGDGSIGVADLAAAGRSVGQRTFGQRPCA